MENISLYDLSTIALSTMFLTELIKNKINLGRTFKQLVPWLIAGGLSYAAASIEWLNSTLYGADTISTVLYGLAAGLVANGIYDVSQIPMLQTLIQSLKKNKST